MPLREREEEMESLDEKSKICVISPALSDSFDPLRSIFSSPDGHYSCYNWQEVARGCSHLRLDWSVLMPTGQATGPAP